MNETQDFLARYCTTDSSELYHHGILGQKWGVRRYQNPDGSLTEEGRKRYLPKGSSRKLVDKAYQNYKDRQREYNEEENKYYNKIVALLEDGPDGEKSRSYYEKTIKPALLKYCDSQFSEYYTDSKGKVDRTAREYFYLDNVEESFFGNPEYYVDAYMEYAKPKVYKDKLNARMAYVDSIKQAYKDSKINTLTVRNLPFSIGDYMREYESDAKKVQNTFKNLSQVERSSNLDLETKYDQAKRKASKDLETIGWLTRQKAENGSSVLMKKQ